MMDEEIASVFNVARPVANRMMKVFQPKNACNGALRTTSVAWVMGLQDAED